MNDDHNDPLKFCGLLLRTFLLFFNLSLCLVHRPSPVLHMSPVSLFNYSGNVNVQMGPHDNDNVNLSGEHLLMFIDSSMVYPKEKSVIDKEVKASQVKLSYTCIDSKCKFEESLAKIMDSAELKGLGVKDLTHVVVTSVSENPNVFPSSQLGGYILQSTGRSYMFLENCTPGIKDGTSLRYGFADLSDVRKKMIFEAIRLKAAKEDNFWKIATVSSIVTLTMSTAYILKKIK